MKRKNINTVPNKKINDIVKQIDKYNISYEDLLELDLTDENLLWFVEYINILNNTPKYTEDHFRIKNLIYSKYTDFKNIKENHNTLDLLTCNTKSHKSNIIYKICNSDYSLDIKAILYNKLLLINDSDKSDECIKMTEWLNIVLNIPLNLSNILIQKPIHTLLLQMQQSLNSNIYGHHKVKESILESYCANLTNPSYKKKFIALVGAPGCGKTAFGRAIADALNCPFNQISFGGIKDPHILTGHSMTYVGAQAGLFTNILISAKQLDSVVLLDEIDKIPNSIEGHSISSVLLHVLDKTQNNKFCDMYLPEVPINLSHIFFILALNEEALLDPILKDRLYIINLEDYTLEDKLNISTQYILPKILKELNFKSQDIIIKNNIFEYIINNYCDGEKGVRKLENKISCICEKLNVLKNIGNNKKIKLSYHISNLKFPVNITNDIIDVLLG